MELDCGGSGGGAEYAIVRTCGAGARGSGGGLAVAGEAAFELLPGGGLDAAQHGVGDARQLVAGAQLVGEAQQQAGGHFGVGEGPVVAAGHRQPGVLDQRAELWLGASGIRRRASSREQANSWRRWRAMRASSASQKRLSKAALWATSGQSLTKSATSPITRSAGGAWRSMALLMPVRASMWAGTRTPAFIRLW